MPPPFPTTHTHPQGDGQRANTRRGPGEGKEGQVGLQQPRGLVSDVEKDDTLILGPCTCWPSRCGSVPAPSGSLALSGVMAGAGSGGVCRTGGDGRRREWTGVRDWG